MPRFGFGSGGSNGISLNSPRNNFSSRSRGSDQARKEKESKSSGKARRRNFGFLKSGIGKTEKSGIENKLSISRRREHAKQLANLAYSDDPTSIATTATSTSTSSQQHHHQQLNNFASFAQVPPVVPQKKSRKIVSRPRTASNKSQASSNSNLSSEVDAFGSSDPFASFDAFGAGFAAGDTSASAPSSAAGFPDSGPREFSEMDFFSDQMAGAVTPAKQSLQKKKQKPKASTPASSTSNTLVSTEKTFFTDDETASFSSNHTNSERTKSSQNSSVSVAARRRMRSHMQRAANGQGNGNHDTSSSASSVGSAFSASQESHSFPPLHTQFPPGSPPMAQNRKNRVAAYSRNSSGSLGSGSNHNNDPHSSPFRRDPFGGSAGSVGSSNANHSVSSPGVNLFDSGSEIGGGGFTFDAFGLDQSQVEREVNDAMQDILGDGGFSIFVEKGSVVGSAAGSGHQSNSSFGQNDSFSGHQTDASDDSFVPQHWDSSPNTSRNASPVPLYHPQSGSKTGHHHHQNGNHSSSFADGFHVDNYPTTPQREPLPHQPQSAQQRRMERRMQQGADFTPSKGTNPLRNAVSEPPKKSRVARSSLDFAKDAFDSSATNWKESDPWEDDPFASSDGGGRISELFSGRGSNDSFSGPTARRLYSETQSNVQDYYHSGTAAAANSLLDVMSPSTPSSKAGNNEHMQASAFSDTKSDVGFSGNRFSFEASSPSFFELPPPEEDAGNQSESDQSDDMDQMQDDLAHEFARDIVRKTISPAARSQQSSQSRRNRYFGGDHIDENDREQNSEYPSQSINNTRDFNRANTPKETTEPTKRFGNFRSRYESQSKSRLEASESASIEATKASTSVPKWKQKQQAALRNQEELPIEEKKEEERAAHPVNREQTQPRRISSLKARWEAKTRPPPEKQIPRASPKAIERSDHTRRSISMMDNSFEMLTPDMVEQRRQERNKNKFDNLRKSMGVMEEEITVDDQTPKSDSGGWRDGSTVANAALNRMHEASSPGKFQSSGTMADSKSDIGSSPSYVANVRLRKVSSPHAVPRSPMMDRSVDKSTLSAENNYSPSPAYQSPVVEAPPERKLTYRERRERELKAHREKKAAEAAEAANQKPVERKMTYRERREMELRNQREQEEKAAAESPVPDKQKERKLTYRERREMELKAQREQEEQTNLQSTSQQSHDVASLIRKRISANKSKGRASSHETSSRSLPNVQEQEEEENTNSRVPQHYPSPSRQHSMLNKPNAPSELKVSTNEGIYYEEDAAINAIDNHRSPQRNPAKMLENMLATRAPPPTKQPSPKVSSSPSTSRRNSAQMLENMLAARAPPSIERPPSDEEPGSLSSSRKDSAKMLENMFAARAPPSTKQNAAKKPSSQAKSPHAMLENMLSAKQNPKPDVSQSKTAPGDEAPQGDVKSMLSGFLSKRAPPALQSPARKGDTESLQKHNVRSQTVESDDVPAPATPSTHQPSSGLPAIKDDPKFEKYFRMLKMGLPKEVVKHAMVRDGLDPSILDLDPNKPAGVPLKEDPKFQKYFKMLKIGISVDQVKNCMERDGLQPSILDQDHNLPVIAIEKPKEKKKKETHRRARLHWKTIQTVVKNSLWAEVQSEVGGIDIDEEEFRDLFQADLKASKVMKSPSSAAKKKGAAVRVIDSKRANNGGIILARVKLTHDQMAEAVDQIDDSTLTAEQIENVIEYLPTKEERDALEKYMLDGGQDAAQKFDGLCECEKFMVSMMTVKHAKRKIRALLFKLQFMTCMESIAKDAQMIDTACDELVNSNRLRQLLGIILQFGNRLNTAGNSSKGKAGGFSLESLSKLSVAKAFDKKTTFLHYIVLIVQRNNELLLKFYDDIPTVMESTSVFWDQCQQDLEEVENQLENVRRISLHEARSHHQIQASEISDDDSLGEMELTLEEEVISLRATQTGLFTLGAIKQVSALREKIERTKAKCLRMNEYFGVKDTEPQEIFTAFADFTKDFQKAKEQVFSTAHKKLREERKKARQKTPTKAKSLPSAGSERAPPGKPLIRASSHQPNMGKLFGDIKKRQTSTDDNIQSSRADLLSSINGRKASGNTNTPSARTSLLSSIKERQSPSENNDPRAGLLNAIKERKSPENGKGGLLEAISLSRSSSGSNEERKPSFENNRAGLLNSIKNRQPASEIKNSNTSTESAREKMRQKAMRNQRSYSNPRISTAAEAIPSQASLKPISTRSPRDTMRNHRRRVADAVRARNANAQGTQ